MNKKIGIFVGSLRANSFSRKLAKQLINYFPADFTGILIPLDDLIMYNQDLDDEHRAPMAWTDFRQSVTGLNGVIFILPEYNRSIPAVIKNALDVGSRPYEQNVWDRKPAAVISISLGSMGGFGANHHLRQVLTCLNMPTMQQPEAYIGNIPDVFDEKNLISDEETIAFFKSFIDSYRIWLNQNAI